ncbi:hypothetical protein GQ55_6G216500 [Panicum hallii var. hallii]|uniref:Replication factor-A protein 1 N-terminal domain-containing protein n=1 Tax=Panicum hallii var. hallii TaxID=1504633 RepID=A0A2T7D886_9POAL|nr:hypothetical protein GQ55_6G216500 [Panicum hallii var. hallii]
MGTIVRLLEFICNSVQNPSMVSVVQLEVLQTDCELIGRSKAYEQPYGLQVKRGELYHGSVPNYAQPDSASYSSGEGLKWLLTQGAVEAMLESKMAVEQQPVMQVVDVSTVSRGKITVYCVLLSDGVYQEHALLCPDAYPLAELRNGSIVRILKFKFNTLNSDTRINYKAFIVKLEILQMECKLIGRPRFHERGLKHKEKEPYLKHAANVPVLPEQSYLSVLGVSEDATKLSDQFHPGYKSMPD